MVRENLIGFGVFFLHEQCGPCNFRKSMVRGPFLMIAVFTRRQSRLFLHGLCCSLKNEPFHVRNPRFIELLHAGYINCGPCYTPAPLTGHILCNRLHFRETVQDKEGFQWIDRLHWCPYFPVTGYKFVTGNKSPATKHTSRHHCQKMPHHRFPVAPEVSFATMTITTAFVQLSECLEPCKKYFLSNGAGNCVMFAVEIRKNKTLGNKTFSGEL